MRKIRALALAVTLALCSTPPARADNFAMHGAITAGSATAPAPTTGDLQASRSTTTGALLLGGTSSSCVVDYGVTTAATLTIPCAVTITGTFTGSGLFAGPVVAGKATAPSPTSGDLEASRSTTTGQLVLGGTSSSCAEDYGVTTAATMTIHCPLNGTGAIVAGSATAAAVSAGDLEASRSTTAGSLTLGGSSSSCTESFAASVLTENCAVTISGGNLLVTGGYVRAGGSVPAGISSGDLAASRSTTAGAIELGGASSACTEDYNVTTASTMTVNCALTATGIVHSNAALTSGGYVSATSNVIAGNSNVPAIHGGSTFGVGTDGTDTPRGLEMACVTSPGACGFGTNSLYSVSGIPGEQACFGPVPNTVCKVTFDHLGNIGAKTVVSATTPFYDLNGSLVTAATAHWDTQTVTLSTNPQTISFTSAFAFAPNCTVSVSGGAGASGHVAVTGTTTTTGVPVIDTSTDIVTLMCYGV